MDVIDTVKEVCGLFEYAGANSLLQVSAGTIAADKRRTAKTRCHVTRKEGYSNLSVVKIYLLYMMTPAERDIHIGMIVAAESLYLLCGGE